MSKLTDLKDYLLGNGDDPINVNVAYPMIDAVVAEVQADVNTYLTVATPTISPSAGAVLLNSTVTLSCSTAGASIYYTTNGNTPDTSSTLYTGPITISGAMTVKAKAYKGYQNASGVLSSAYTITQVATPVGSPVAGTVLAGSTVALTCATEGAEIHYTLDGSTPDYSDPVYEEAITIPATTTIKAIALKALHAASAVFTGTYTVATVATPTANPVAGVVLANSTVALTSATGGSTIYYTTNGDTPTVDSTEYTAPISITNATTIKAIAVKSGLTNSAVMSQAYTIQQVAAPTSNVPAGAITTATQITLSSATELAAIYYTIDGSEPGIGDTQYLAPFTIDAGCTLKAIAIKANMTDSTVSEYVYTIAQVATPESFPVAGAVPDNTPVTIVSETLGATIYYTTNGVAPTIESTEYTVPVVVTDTMTIKALAVKAGMTNSAIMSSTYTVV